MPGDAREIDIRHFCRLLLSFRALRPVELAPAGTNDAC